LAIEGGTSVRDGGDQERPPSGLLGQKANNLKLINSMELSKVSFEEDVLRNTWPRCWIQLTKHISELIMN
jgi:hypothetical protein